MPIGHRRRGRRRGRGGSGGGQPPNGPQQGGQFQNGQSPNGQHGQPQGGQPSHNQNQRPQGGHSGHNHHGGGHQGPSASALTGIPEPTQPARRPWEDLTSIDPQPRLTLEYPGCPASCRLIDLFCPIGRGQRGLIVSPPKAGKTTLLKDIGTALLRNHPDIQLIILLVDERPEEVTDFKRTFANIGRDAAALAGEIASTLPPDLAAGVNPQGVAKAAGASRVHVVASSNDHPVERHIEISIKTMEICKRKIAAGEHVVILLDSLTRLGRAFNQSRKHAGSGRTMTGGLDSKALEVPRQIFGSARNTEEAGSLTIIASCLVDTGSAADQVIFEEFKGSGNMELILDRKIAERRLFPAINLAESGTRKEEYLMGADEMKTMTALRRRLLSMPPPQQVEQLLAALKRFPTNAALVGGAAGGA